MERKTKGGNNKMTALKSTMAGTVFTVNVAVGEEVTAGQVIIVLESMKMEIPIEAETAGKVTAINVQVGDFVNDEDVLATIEA
jgi:acetyl-CoA carboxylase biotin carboxyl carrier protein